MILTLAYLAGNIAAEALYVPQVVKVVRDREAAKALSPSTWIGWTFTSIVSLAYMWVDIGDWPVIAMTAINTVFLLMISACIIYSRVAQWRCKRLLTARL